MNKGLRLTCFTQIDLEQQGKYLSETGNFVSELRMKQNVAQQIKNVYCLKGPLSTQITRSLYKVLQFEECGWKNNTTASS